MGTRQQHGFTIIEISLFVAISGLLALGLLTGWSLAINSQRYKDSVDSFYAYIQQQYSLVYSVENGRSSNFTCNSDSVVTPGDADNPRGQSDCMLLGRYLRITDGSKFESFAIVGNENSSSDGTIASYKPRAVDAEIGLTESEFVIPWGARVSSKQSQAPLNIGIAIIRSPSNGVVYTYVNTDTNNNVSLAEMTVPANQKEQYFCVWPDAGVSGAIQAVYIPQYAASLNAVETLGDNSGC